MASPEEEAFRPLLERLNVPHDGILVVHSAIGALSRQGFRAEAMIENFLDHLRGGTLVMPTMTWRSVTPANPHWDEIATPSHTGVLTEIFRTRYAAARSIHPTHSVAAAGPLAEHLTSRHQLDDTPVSANSPYGLMRGHEAFILTIGVGLECVTAIHLPEETVAPEIYVRPTDQTETYYCRDRHGVVHAVRTRRHWRLDRDFPKFERPLAEKQQLVAWGIGDCTCRLMPMQALLDEVCEALARDRNATLNKVSRPVGTR